MGAARSLGLCLVLSSVAWTRGGLAPCPQCPLALCLNSTHCGCPPGHLPPPWPRDPYRLQGCDDINECLELPPPCGPSQTCINSPGGFNCSCSFGYRQGPPPETPTPGPPSKLHCVDVDECAEGGSDLCGGGSVCFNTPGGFECHCPPGYVKTPPQNHCTAVPKPPQLCPEEQSDCEELKPLTHLYELLRGGGDPLQILQELLTSLDGLFEGGVAPGGVSERHLRASALLGATERLLRWVGAQLPPGAVTNVTSEHSDLLLAAHPGPPPAALTLRLPGVTLEVPKEVAGDSDTGPPLVALLSHGGGLSRALEGGPEVRWGGWGDLPPRRGPPSYRILSPIATALLTPPRGDPPRGHPLQAEVTLSFRHPPPDPKLGGRLLCAFWDPQGGRWDTQGCRQVQPPPQIGDPSPQNGTSCACSHLTSFAVLFAFRELPDHWVLDVVTQVGLGASIAALLLALGTFLLCRALRGLRTTLHAHLSLSLLLAQGTFLLGIDSTHSPRWCAAAAALQHFWFLAAFCWMGLEGLHLHALLVRVFLPSWLRLRHLLLAGYGPPAAILGIAAAAFPGGYGTDRYCWLTLKRGFRWSFQGPACVIIAANAAILVVTIWKLVQKFGDINPDMGHLRRMRVLVVTSLGQLCLLGTCWALGLGLGLEGVSGGGEGGGVAPLPLLFSALNAAQGLFIFICHCLAHPKVREAYRSCLCPAAKPYAEFSSSSSTTRVSRQLNP